MLDGFKRVEGSSFWKPEWVATRGILVKYGDIEVTIERGFKTDFLTRPWFLRFLFRGKKFALAALLHDWLYVHKPFSRVLCDALFYQVLKDSGVKSFIRSSMFGAVLVCGGKHWDD